MKGLKQIKTCSLKGSFLLEKALNALNNTLIIYPLLKTWLKQALLIIIIKALNKLENTLMNYPLFKGPS